MSMYLLCFLLLNLLALSVNSTPAAYSGQAKLTELRDERGDEVYMWTISNDEQDRLTTLLGSDFYEVGVMGTYVNAPPQTCKHCGKETEFIDWVYTALKRGVHSPEFIAESLRQGRTPKGVDHDVYCSRCGHLTAARNLAGHEGGALHIAHATPYDRATKTFMKRALEVSEDEASVKRDTSDVKIQEEKALNWCGACGAGNWVIKRDSEATLEEVEQRDILAKKDEKALSWCTRCAPGNWQIKREPLSSDLVDTLVKKDEKALSWCTRCAPGNWQIKRESPPADLVKPLSVEKEELSSAAVDGGDWRSEDWFVKRDDKIVNERAEAPAVENKQPSTAVKWCVDCGPENWVVKRDNKTISDQAQAPRIEKKEPSTAAKWCASCGPGGWVVKRDDKIVNEQARSPTIEKKEPSTAAKWCASCGPGGWVVRREPETVA